MKLEEIFKKAVLALLICFPLFAFSQKTDTAKMGIKLLVESDSLNKDGEIVHPKNAQAENYYAPIDSAKVDIYRNDSLVGHMVSTKLHYTNTLKLAASKYDLEASKPGFVTQTVKDVVVEDGQILYQVIVLDRIPVAKKEDK